MKSSKFRRVIVRSKRIVIFLVSALGALFGFLSYDHQRCMAFRDTAMSAFGRQKWTFASEQFNSYLKCNPTDQQVLDFGIEASFYSGNITETRRWIDRTQKFFPEDPMPRYWDGVLLLLDESHQDLPKSMDTLMDVRDQVLDTFPEVDLYIGIAKLKTGNFDDGCEFIRSYLELSKKDGDNATRQDAESTYQQRCS